MADDACLVCFRSNGCDLDTAAAELARVKLNVVRRGDELAINYPDGPVLRIAYSTEEHVAEEAEEIAESNPLAAAMLPCNVRFEILIDDLDAALQEYSTLFAAQEMLAELTGGFGFNTWNGQFPWPSTSE